MTSRIGWTIVAALFATGLWACAEEATTPDGDDDPVVVEGAIEPGFELGQTWVVGTLYRQANMRLPEEVALWLHDPDTSDEFTPHVPDAVAPADGELWSSVIYWQFGVINTDFIPDAESSFYDLALDRDGTPQPITIIKAIAPKELNGEALSDQLDPVFYLIIRESDFRVRGVHYNYRVPGGRNTVVLELPENRTGEAEPGADLNLFLVDYFMPIFPLDDAEDYIVEYGVEATDALSVRRIEDDAVSVEFESAMDNRLVQQRWDADNPWFTWSATDARISWLAAPAEVAELMELHGVEFITTEAFQESTETIAQKFRNRIDLGAELSIEAGPMERTVATSYQPWAGDYWPTRRSALSMGFNGRDRSISASSPTRQAVAVWTNEEGETIEQRLRAVDQELDELLDVDRNAEDFDSNAFNTRVREYYAEKRAIVTDLRDWFEDPETGFVARLRAGDVELDDVHNWSPLDKFGLYLMSQGVARPFEAAIWEAGTQFHPGGPGWWGKCNGWSAAAILFDEPREDLTLSLPLGAINGGDGSLSMTMQTADLKGLVTASNYSGYSVFYGERYNGEDDELADLYPAVFHRIITYYIGTEHFPLVFDTTASEQVWNFPAYRYESDITEGGTDAENNCQIMNVRTRLRFSTDGVSEDHVDGAGSEPEGFWNEYTYDLCVRDGIVIGDGEWTGSSVENHPDFAWVIYQNDPRPSRNARYVTDSSRDAMFFGQSAPSENPFLYTDVLDTMLSPRVNAPEVCNPEPNDCPNGDICVVETGECREREEGEDPNPMCDGGETREVALAVGAGGLDVQHVCSGIDSWYKISLDRGDTVEIVAVFQHGSGDIDIALFDSSNQRMASSTSTSDRETITVGAPRDGDYLLRVYGYNGAENDVAITITVTPASAGGGDECLGEDDEPNGSDAPTVITGGVAEREAAICNADDEDYYDIQIDGGYSVLIEFDHAKGDLDVQLLSTDGQDVLDRSAGTSNSEEVTGSGPALLRVYGWNSATGPYTLTIVED